MRINFINQYLYRTITKMKNRKIMKMVGNLFGTDPDPDWNTTLSYLLTRSYDRVTFILLRLVLQVTVYYIWRERNERKHHTSNKTIDQLVKMIDKTVRDQITSTKYPTRGYMDWWIDGLLLIFNSLKVPLRFSL